MNSFNVVFPAKREVQVVREPVPAPAAGEVLCRAEVSAVSTGTETFCLAGEFDPGTNWSGWVRYPFSPGYSMTATVETVGAGIETDSRLAPGTRVAARAPHRELFVTDVRRLIPIPDGVANEEAAFLPIAITAQQGVRRAALSLGETAVVIGAGLIGLFTVEYLALQGCRRIIVIDTLKSRLTLAQSLGATDTLALDIREARPAVQEITGGGLADVVFDATGAAPVLEHATTLLRKMGRVVLVGDNPTPSHQRMGPRIVADSIAILGIHMTMSPPEPTELAPWTYDAMAGLIFDYLLQRRMNVRDLITHRHSPEEAPAVYRQLLSDRSSVLGVLFEWKRLRE